MSQLTTIKISGMTCNHCKANVENNLKKLPGIESVV
ncbi:MAG: heavy-metal-associated domain-containing protein, partial [Bacteroidales bacterium]